MTRRLLSLIAAAFILAAVPASANVIVMCQGDVSGASTGSRTIGGTGSAVPSGTLYSLNAGGCAPILAQDVGYFQSQGYTQNGLNSLMFVVPVAATGTTSYQIGTLPPSTYIRDILVSNTDATHAVTGNIAFGTTSGAADVVTSLAVSTSAVTFVTDANLAKRIFSTTAGQALFASAITSWNTPTTVTITVTYGYF